MQLSIARRAALAALALTCIICPAAPAAPDSARSIGPARGEYVDVGTYLQTDAGIEAWYTLRANLARNFDAICGDAFCEGDYSNIQALRYVCSVHRISGRIGSCGWSFAASDESIVPSTGRIAVRRGWWSCRSPLTPGTTIESMLDALQGEEPLYATLPGSDRTIYDGLVDCL